MKPIINTFTKQNVIETLKLTPTIVIAIRYYISRQNYQRQVSADFKSTKCNISVVTQALVLCLICMPEAGGLQTQGLCTILKIL